MVDPQYDGNDKASAIWQVTASTKRPRERTDTEGQVAEMLLQQGHIAQNITGFIDQLETCRNKSHG